MEYRIQNILNLVPADMLHVPQTKPEMYWLRSYVYLKFADMSYFFFHKVFIWPS